MAELKPVAFRVQNFRNVDDRGWIKLDRVTALVGRNESGKTALLQALHKFNPATKAPYTPQREFPRDRFQSQYTEAKAKTFPVCSVRFEIQEPLRTQIDAITGTPGSPATVVATRYYDQVVRYALEPAVPPQPALESTLVSKALDDFSTVVRRIEPPGGDEAAIETLGCRSSHGRLTSVRPLQRVQ